MTTLIVPAAGEGSRLGSACPKALVELGGRPLIEWVLSAADGQADRIVVVIQPRQQPQFEAWAANARVPAELAWAFQETPAGSLDAVRIGVEHALRQGPLGSGVIIAWSDQVGVGASTLKLVAESVASNEKVLAVPLCETAEPYVWVELDPSGRIDRVLRTRDGDPSPESGLADLGIFGLSASLALSFLDIAGQAALVGDGRELDFTYSLTTLSARADVTFLPRVSDRTELLAVNTAEDLSRAAEILGRRDD